jgi:hypothetical protein
MKRLVQGVGINDADYVVNLYERVRVDGQRSYQKLVWRCPIYNVWRNVIERCYSEKCKVRQPTYKDCTTCEEWKRFSNFKAWMEQQYWEGKELDKDLLFNGNKIYSPETCIFVSKQVNLFIRDNSSVRGKHKIGLCWDKYNNCFKAACGNPFTGKQEHLGMFSNEEDAHQAWLSKKLEHAYVIASLQTDERVAKALINRYENYIGGEPNE